MGLRCKGMHREWEFGIPIFPWKWTQHGVIQDWEWEMSQGNGMGKIPTHLSFLHSTLLQRSLITFWYTAEES